MSINGIKVGPKLIWVASGLLFLIIATNYSDLYRPQASLGSDALVELIGSKCVESLKMQ